MNYFEIGQRIRKYRKAQNLSQEELAEKVGISVTHMSHIETGNTKLSLPVFVKMSEFLQVSTDALLFDAVQTNKNTIETEILKNLQDCSAEQLMVLNDIVKHTKIAMNKYL